MGSPVYNNFQNLITFSRGTNATLFNGAGLLTYAPNNLLRQSQAFNDSSVWSAGTYTGTITPDTTDTTAPDGTNTAEKFDTTAINSYIFQSVTTAAVTYVYSFYAKAGTANSIRVNVFDTVDHRAVFSLVDGSVSAPTNVTSTAATNVGNGWWRVSITYTGSVATASVRVFSPQTGTLYVWGAQLEVVTYQTTPSTYVATTASAYYGPRLDYDPVTLALRGMLVEEQRTNFVTWSEDFTRTASWTMASTGSVSPNAISAPDGGLADKIIPASNGTTSGLSQVVPGIFLNGRTASFYIRAGEITQVTGQNGAGQTFTINLTAGTITANAAYTNPTITPVGGSWYRVALTWGTAAGFDFYIGAQSGAGGTNGFYLWGFQLELGTFPTSYIPTGASSVTRNADVATMSGSQFTPWYNGTQGTLVLSWTAGNVVGLSNTIFYLDDNDGTQYQNVMSSRQSNGVTPTAGIQFNVRDNSIDQAVISTTTPTLVAGSVYRAAPAYAPSNFAVCINSGTVATDTSGTVPAGIDMLRIAGHRDGTRLNGWIRSITYYPRRLSDTQLQRLTA